MEPPEDEPELSGELVKQRVSWIPFFLFFFRFGGSVSSAERCEETTAPVAVAAVFLYIGRRQPPGPATKGGGQQLAQKGHMNP